MFRTEKYTKAKGKRQSVKPGRSVSVRDIISSEVEPEKTSMLEEVDDLVQIESSSTAGSNTKVYGS